MRLYQVSFACGLAAGYVLGARAGRERYQQIVKGARAFAEHPAVRQATESVRAGAGDLARSATRTAASRGRSGLARINRKREDPRVPGQAGKPRADSPPSGRHHGMPSSEAGKRPSHLPASGDFGDFQVP